MTDAALGAPVPRTRAFAIAAVALAAVAFSLNGFFVRNLEAAGTWQIVFWRASGLALAVSAMFLWQHRRRAAAVFRQGLPIALVAAPTQGVGVILFIYSLTHTTVANTMMMLSATPLFAALLGWAFLGERVGWATAAAIAATMAGIGLMTVDGLAGGSLWGNLAALGNAATFAIFITYLRRGRGGDMRPTVILGALTGVVLAALIGDGILAAPLHDILLCLAWGAFAQTAGMTLMLIGSRGLPAAEISLVAMVEFVLAPTWAWTVTGELPTPLSATGGGIIFAAMLGWSFRRARLDRPVPLRPTGS
ncbi:DMT family transporter [Stella sp.]|uniref:DMT family transporter n=1 Tax=Stella sp. TaxID=2912054 RepID=UPI0035B1BDF6